MNKPPVVRRTISAHLQTQHGWKARTSVDGSIIVTIDGARDPQQFAKEVRAAVEAMGYTPRVAISQRTVVVTTPETVAQANEGRGVHGADAAKALRPVTPVRIAPHPLRNGASAGQPSAVADVRQPRLTATEVGALPWVKALRPTREPYLAELSHHCDLKVWHVEVEFSQLAVAAQQEQRWSIPEINVAETWRKRPLLQGLDSGCGYSCGEVELTARLRKAGLQAWWVSEWSGFQHVAGWDSFCVKRSELLVREPRLHANDAAVRARAGALGIQLGNTGGHPDVVAWSGASEVYCYVEYKGPGDEIKAKQNDYARALVALNEYTVTYVAVHGTIR